MSVNETLLYKFNLWSKAVHIIDKMSFPENVKFMLFTNPFTENTIRITKKTLNPVLPAKIEEIPVQPTIITERIPLYKLVQDDGPFIRIAGLMGASAIFFGAYGAQRIYPKQKEELIRIYKIGNMYHFINSLALLGVPMCRYPKISGSLLIIGISLFSGACYYHAITGENRLRKLAPVGGACLILGWLTMVLI